MPKISYIKIENFRKLKKFEYQFSKVSNVVCIVGRGDSGKSTLLEAISLVLSPSWNESFNDSDFTDLDVSNPINIETIVYDLPESLNTITGAGLFYTFLDKETLNVIDDITDNSIPAIRIKLTVTSELEPKWIMKNATSEQSMRASDRAKLNVFLISDLIDRHFSWNKGTPLASLLKKEQTEKPLADQTNVLLDVVRNTKKQFDDTSWDKFSKVQEEFVKTANKFGLNIEKIKTTIDWKDLYYSEGRLCLHEDNIPFRLKGKGSKRLLSIALQISLFEQSGIILIDEVEQGLEPDRVQQLVQTLKKIPHAQIFLTTHSSNVVVELDVHDIFKLSNNTLFNFPKNGINQQFARTNPEAFFARRLLIAEGATEVGILRALNSYLGQDDINLSAKGIRIVNGGGGSHMISYCEAIKTAEYDICLLRDNDRPEDDRKLIELEKSGYKIVCTEKGLCIEKQLFKNLTWPAVIKLFELGKTIKRDKELKPLRDNGFIDEKYDLLEDSPVIREFLGKISNGELDSEGKSTTTSDEKSKYSWFKTITHGEEIGIILFSDLQNTKGTHLYQMFESLINWTNSNARPE